MFLLYYPLGPSELAKDLLESLHHLKFGQLFVYTFFYASQHQLENEDSGTAFSRSLFQPEAFTVH